MKHLFKTVLVTGLALGVFTTSPAQARENESCFSQKTVSGWVRICSQNDGGFEFNLGAYGDRHNDWQDNPVNYAVPVKQVVYYYPAGYFVPPGHYKQQDWRRRYHRDEKDHDRHHDDDRHRHNRH